MKNNTADDTGRAKEAAYRILKYRQRSRWELAGKLSEKGFRPETVAAVVGELEKSGYLDDRKFARDFVEFKLASNPAGRKYFKAELARKHVDSEIIDGVLEELLPEQKEFEVAYNIALKKISRYSDSDMKSKWRKVYGYLGRKGFPAETISRIFSIAGCRTNGSGHIEF